METTSILEHRVLGRSELHEDENEKEIYDVMAGQARTLDLAYRV